LLDRAGIIRLGSHARSVARLACLARLPSA